MDDLNKRRISDSLRDSALNDVENCVHNLLTNPLDENNWTEFNSSLQNAQTLGVKTESVLSKLLNSLPDPIKNNVVNAVAKKHNLSENEIDGILAPED